MPAQMSHVNKLLAVRKQQQKEGTLVLFLAHDCTQDLELKPLKRRRGEGICLLSRKHQPPLKSFKNKMKN